ncbi:flagellar motor switch phosphatase FliY [Bacillus fonticola]|uniref:flagellar motor switch phosphatase FliY n=1 Tax=Bacillus fonticola TaxID=2728853 RepID=UPI0014745AE7|nr:flagellar motor switch phosphatase FliY [Bacillus fonticola]
MMNDGMLSQDEIDALLRGTDDEPTENKSAAVEDYFNLIELDALGEIGNISFGSSATALSQLLNQKVEITTPTVSVVERSKLSEEFPHPYVAIQVQYTEGFAGENLLIIKQSDAAIIADLMLGGDGQEATAEFGEIQISAVQEAMNQMMGSAATSMSTVFSKRVDISPPNISLLDVQHGEGTEYIPEENMLARVAFRLKVGELIDSTIMQLLPVQFARSLVHELLSPQEEEVQPGTMSNEQPVQPPFAVSEAPTKLAAQPEHPTRENPAQPTQEAVSQMAQQPRREHEAPEANVQPATFSQFAPGQTPRADTRNLDMLLDIPLQVTVELGRTKRSVKEILELSSGSILELDKLAGEPVDILVNDRLVAKGEVVVIEENFGVRVTDILSQADRLKKIR